MPRETVPAQAGLFELKVGWSTERDVQVGIEVADGRSIVDWLLGLTPGRPEAARIRQAVVDAVGEEPASFTGLWGNLDRAGCNRLIELVRRARDSAYGKD